MTAPLTTGKLPEGLRGAVGSPILVLELPGASGCAALAISPHTSPHPSARKLARHSRRRLSRRALTATSTLEPDIEMAASSGRRVKPQGSNTPAAIGRASEL